MVNKGRIHRELREIPFEISFEISFEIRSNWTTKSGEKLGNFIDLEKRTRWRIHGIKTHIISLHPWRIYGSRFAKNSTSEVDRNF